MTFFHLSHTDLDGYGCQLLTNEIFPEGFFKNSNYGEEIISQFETILSSLKYDSPSYILISDLNLTISEAKYIEEKIDRLTKDGYKITLKLFDHHISSIECAQRFKWYYVDVTKSATKILYEHFSKQGYKLNKYKRIVEIINAIDIWLEDSKYFEFGKVFNRLIEEAKELNRIMFPKESTTYKLYMLKKGNAFLNKTPIELDENIFYIKRDFFANEKIDTIDNLIAEYIVKLLNPEKEKISISYKEKRGILTYEISNSSIIGNLFLKENPEFYFFMNLNPKGGFNLRANNKMNVSKMAYEIANGGGHPNASGGKFEDFEEKYSYDEIHNFVTKQFNNLTSSHILQH